MRRYFSEKTEIILIGFFCLGLLLLSLVYYKERIIFTDTAGCLMDMFKKNTLNVTTNRFVSILGQVLPLIAYRLNASLNTILILYSLNLILLPVSCCLLSVFWLKETRTAWSILLFYTLTSNRLFYFPVSEFQMGLCLLLFYVGIYEQFLKERIKPVLFWVISLLLIPTIVFSHPLSVLVLSAWLVWQLFINKSVLWKTVSIGLITIVTYTIKAVFFRVPYDAEKSQGLDNFVNTSIASYFDNHLANQFYKAVREDYFFLPFLIIGAIIAFVYARKYLAAISFICITIGFWLLVTVSFKNEEYGYYLEHMYQPVTFFITLVAARYCFPALKQSLRIPIIAIMLLVSLNITFLGRIRMQKRLEWYTGCFKLMEAKGITKTAVAIGRLDIGWRMETYWLAVYESILFSALEGSDKTKAITIVWNEDHAREAVKQNRDLLTVGLEHFPRIDLPAQYFKVGDEPYVILADVYPHDIISRISYSDQVSLPK